MLELGLRFKLIPGIPVMATAVSPLELRKVLPPQTDREEFYLSLIEVLGKMVQAGPPPGTDELDDEGEPISYADMVRDRDRYKRIANDAYAERASIYRKLKLLNITQGATASVETRLQMLIDGLNELADLK